VTARRAAHGKDWTFRYGLTLISSMDSMAYLGEDPATRIFNFKAGSYTTSDVSVKYTGRDKWTVLVGMRNLTNETPKTISEGAYDRVGNSLLYSGYDYYGRREWASVSKSL
jgi:outer membrane receptor protein involved in Fe transport